MTQYYPISLNHCRFNNIRLDILTKYLHQICINVYVSFTYTIYSLLPHTMKTNKQVGSEISAILNQDKCYKCASPGVMTCCDGCPRSMHAECATLVYEPPLWMCPVCIRASDSMCPFCSQPVEKDDATQMKCSICRKNAHQNCHLKSKLFLKKKGVATPLGKKTYVCKKCFTDWGIRRVIKTNINIEKAMFREYEHLGVLVELNHPSPVHWQWFSQKDFYLTRNSRSKPIDSNEMGGLIRAIPLPIIQKILRLRKPSLQGSDTTSYWLVKWQGKAYSDCTWQTDDTVEVMDPEGRLRERCERQLQGRLACDVDAEAELRWMEGVRQGEWVAVTAGRHCKEEQVLYGDEGEMLRKTIPCICGSVLVFQRQIRPVLLLVDQGLASFLEEGLKTIVPELQSLWCSGGKRSAFVIKEYYGRGGLKPQVVVCPFQSYLNFKKVIIQVLQTFSAVMLLGSRIDIQHHKKSLPSHSSRFIWYQQPLEQNWQAGQIEHVEEGMKTGLNRIVRIVIVRVLLQYEFVNLRQLSQHISKHSSSQDKQLKLVDQRKLKKHMKGLITILLQYQHTFYAQSIIDYYCYPVRPVTLATRMARLRNITHHSQHLASLQPVPSPRWEKKHDFATLSSIFNSGISGARQGLKEGYWDDFERAVESRCVQWMEWAGSMGNDE